MDFNIKNIYEFENWKIFYIGLRIFLFCELLRITECKLIKIKIYVKLFVMLSFGISNNIKGIFLYVLRILVLSNLDI